MYAVSTELTCLGLNFKASLCTFTDGYKNSFYEMARFLEGHSLSDN